MLTKSVAFFPVAAPLGVKTASKRVGVLVFFSALTAKVFGVAKFDDDITTPDEASVLSTVAPSLTSRFPALVVRRTTLPASDEGSKLTVKFREVFMGMTAPGVCRSASGVPATCVLIR